MTSAPRDRALEPRLLIGPGLVVLALVLLKLSDVLLFVGPFDRAQFGWTVPIPMLLLAPGAIGVAARWSGPAAARRIAVLTGVVLGVAVGVAWFASLTQVGCDPHADTVTRLLASLPIPLVLGIGWAAAGWTAIAFSSRPVVAVLVGAAGALLAGAAMIAASALLFPGVSCSAGALAG